MTTREDLRQRATEVRTKLQGRRPATPPVPDVAPVAPWWPSFINEAVWGSVWGRAGLDLRYRSIATMSCLTALQRLPQLRTHLPDALRLGLTPGEIVEIICQVAFYAGIPTSVNSLGVAGEVFEDQGVPLPAEEVPWDADTSLGDLESRGRVLREELMGRGELEVTPAAEELAPWFWRLMLQYGYGMLWRRPALDRKSRAVCAMAALTALGAAPALRESIDAGLNGGITKAEVVEILCHTAPYAGFPAALAALEAARAVFVGHRLG
jgi:4-carboxymuconolactone decarboxylase